MTIPVQQIIDCDANPFIPECLELIEHCKGGQQQLDMSKLVLYLSDKQKDRGVILGHDLRKELEGVPVLNANVLDYMLANQSLIPEEWKGKAIFFWGTIYRDSSGFLCVRFLYWDVECDRWASSNCWLDDDWEDNDPAVFLSQVSTHIIDCDADPFVPKGKVEEHRKGGQLQLDLSKLALYLSDEQKDGGAIYGHELRKELKGVPVLNANVLDYMLTNQSLIPEEWKDKVVFFWGTIYCDSNGYLYVRFLYWYDELWVSSLELLDFYWDVDDPAVSISQVNT